MIMPSLTGKTALVSGASRGMGRPSALALAAAQVLVHYGRGANEADGVVAEIRKAGGRADAVATDLAAADGASKLARQERSIVGDRLHPCRQCRGLESRDHRGNDGRGFRQSLRGQRPRAVLSCAAA